MTFKPTTYLVSFALFVMLFMALGGYFGYGKIADHFLAQSYLDAIALDVQVQADAQGPLLRWDERVPLRAGGPVRLLASNRPVPVLIQDSEVPARETTAIPLAANERVEDLRVDRARRFLYARVFAASEIKEKELTWLCKYDLEKRKFLRRAAVNPILLPAPFRP